jgi:outer membrane receptor protein involved in Fe transport
MLPLVSGELPEALSLAFIGGEASYTSGSFGDAANTPALRSDSRLLLNVRAGFEAENLSVFAYVDNLTDEYYVEEAGLTLSTVGAPRTFGVATQVNF